MMDQLLRRVRHLNLVLMLPAVMALAIACDESDGEDRPGNVEVIGSPASGSVSASGTGTGSGSGTGSGTGTGSGSSTGTASASGVSGPIDAGPSGELGGYDPASDVAVHAKITTDVVEVNRLLDEESIDYEAIRAIYEGGMHSENSDGSVRTLAGFARSTDRSEPVWDDYATYYDDPAWLDTYVMQAIEGTGPFEGESDAVRRQGIQKGLQNQILVMWTIHELVAAQEKVANGETDPASGAPHNWDEAWAFYHGESPDGAPFSTANKRGENFGTGTAVNDAILASMQEGLDAALQGEAEALRVAADEVMRQITVTYVQATMRYGQVMQDDLAEGDQESARVHQAEGWAFYRVIEPMVAAADPAAAESIDAAYDLANEPSESADAIRTALESVYDDLGITAEEVGTLQ